MRTAPRYAPPMRPPAPATPHFAVAHGQPSPPHVRTSSRLAAQKAPTLGQYVGNQFPSSNNQGWHTYRTTLVTRDLLLEFGLFRVVHTLLGPRPTPTTRTRHVRALAPPAFGISLQDAFPVLWGRFHNATRHVGSMVSSDSLLSCAVRTLLAHDPPPPLLSVPCRPTLSAPHSHLSAHCLRRVRRLEASSLSSA